MASRSPSLFEPTRGNRSLPTMSSAFKNRARPDIECLEDRRLRSWGSTPPISLPSGGDRFTFNRASDDGMYRTVDRISRGEVDSYKFTAQRTGKYTFEASKATGSRIDTVVALYDS